MKKVICVLILAACTALASANPGAVVTGAAVVPVYSAVAGQQQGNEEIVTLLKELVAAVKENTEAVKGLAASKGGGVAPPAIPPADAAITVASKSCLKCHAPKTADAAGGGFRLFADDTGQAFAPLNPRDRQRVMARVSNGSMPPPASNEGKALKAPDRKVLGDFFK